jgi:hypothetical protein
VVTTQADTESRTEYTYNTKGLRTGYTQSVNGKVSISFTYTRDKYNRITKITTKDSKGALIGSTALTYKNKTTTYKYYDAYNTLYMTVVATQDANGNLISQKQSGSAVTDMVTDYTYIAIEVPADSLRHPIT